MSGQVDAAIAAVQQPEPVRMREHRVTISSSGRPAALIVPDDCTDAELAELCGWILTEVLVRQRRRSSPSRILVPS